MTQLEKSVLGAGFVAMTEDELYAVNGGASGAGHSTSCKLDKDGNDCTHRNDSPKKTRGSIDIGPIQGPHGEPGIGIRIHF